MTPLSGSDFNLGLQKMADIYGVKMPIERKSAYSEALTKKHITGTQWDSLVDKCIEEFERLPAISQILGIFFSDKNHDRVNAPSTWRPHIIVKCTCGSEFAVREDNVQTRGQEGSYECAGYEYEFCNVAGIDNALILKHYDRKDGTFILANVIEGLNPQPKKPQPKKPQPRQEKLPTANQVADLNDDSDLKYWER